MLGGYMSGGPGNVLSPAALRTAVERGGLLAPSNASLCKTGPDSEDDVILGELVGTFSEATRRPSGEVGLVIHRTQDARLWRARSDHW